jgi:hypothetical protein
MDIISERFLLELILMNLEESNYFLASFAGTLKLIFSASLDQHSKPTIIELPTTTQSSIIIYYYQKK